MSRGVNKTILIGNLGKDPEVRYTPQGGAVANLSLATDESYKDRNTGQMVPKTEWHRVVVFGKPAEIIAQYSAKGSKLYIEGKLQTRKWQNQQGQDVYTTEIIVGAGGSFQLLDGKPQDDNSQDQGNYQQQGGHQGGQQQQGNRQNQYYQQTRGGNMPGGGQQQPTGNNMPPPEYDFDDQIPF